MVLIMHPSRWPLMVIGSLLACTGVALFWQHQQAAALRVEIDQRRTEAQARARLLADNRQAQDDLNALHAERAAVESLRSDLAVIELRAKTNARSPAPPGPATWSGPGVSESPLMKGEVAAAQWRDAGAATPQAAFESALWAAAGGDVKALADLLTLAPVARSNADDYFARLPAALKAELGSAEQLLALLTAKDVPLGGARITGVLPSSESETRLITQLTDAHGQKKNVSFKLLAQDGRWRIVVPAAVVAQYRDRLRAPPGDPK
jgi:hypothetical protein